jgi:3D (Asp-Asp-Asp) domain-containing protein
MITKSAIVFAGRGILIGAMVPSLLFASPLHPQPSKLALATPLPTVRTSISAKKGVVAQKKSTQTTTSKQKVKKPVTFSESHTASALTSHQQQRKILRVWGVEKLAAPREFTRHARSSHILPLGTFTLRAYTRLRSQPANQKTATGTLPEVGRTVAVDPRIIPLGTKIYIPGLGERIAEDVGRRVKGKRLDVFLPTVSHCREFGVQSREILAFIE